MAERPAPTDRSSVNLNIQKNTDSITQLQKDMSKFEVLVDKLDETINKLSIFLNSVSNLITIHDTKLTYYEKTNVSLADMIKGVQTDMSNQHRDINARINALEKWMWLVVGGSVAAGVILNLILRVFVH